MTFPGQPCREWGEGTCPSRLLKKSAEELLVFVCFA